MNRKSNFVAYLVILALTCIGLAVTAYAEELVIEAVVSDVVTKLDKNGNPYTRVIVEENKTLKGVNYTVGTPVMGFGETQKQLEGMAKGDTLKAIVQPREFRGRTSYTLIRTIE